jgi:hypothetical protein
MYHFILTNIDFKFLCEHLLESYSEVRITNFLRTDIKVTHIHLVPKSKNLLSYTSIPPIRLYGVVLSRKKALGLHLSEAVHMMRSVRTDRQTDRQMDSASLLLFEVL